MFSNKLVFSVILSSFLVSVSAIRCYQCNSANDTGCHDLGTHRPHLTATYFKECDTYEEYNGRKPFCRKTVLEVILPIKEKRTIRSCGWVQYHIPCYKSENDDHIESSCQCFEDGCNGSCHKHLFSVVTLSMISLLVYLVNL